MIEKSKRGNYIILPTENSSKEPGMKKVCIIHETGSGRLPGHYTEFAFTGLPGVEIAALADPNPDAAEFFFRTGAKKLYTSWQEMIDRERPDITILSSRLVEDHYIQIKFALEHGSHVLCEKPLAADLIQADELIALSQQKGSHVQIAHPARFAPVFRKMKTLIEDGAIGRVLTCYMRGKEDHRGGGEDMIVLGTHIFDAAAWIFGMPVEVMADVRWQNRRITAKDILPASEPVGPCAGDEILAIFRFPDGISGIFESRRDVSGPYGEKRLGITVCGTAGSLTIRYTGNRELRMTKNFPVPPEDGNAFEVVPVEVPPEIPGAAPIDFAAWKINEKNYALRYFAENNRRAAWNLLQAIEGREELAAGIVSARNAIEMISGVYRSGIEGRSITFPLTDRHHPLL